VAFVNEALGIRSQLSDSANLLGYRLRALAGRGEKRYIGGDLKFSYDPY
jgi:hypothetical protein